MIQAKLSNGDFLYGLDAENIKRLTTGNPIVIDLTLVGGPAHKILIMYGDTQKEILAALEDVTGQTLSGETH